MRTCINDIQFFDKKPGATTTNKGTWITFENQQLVEESYKPLIREIRKPKVYSSFKENTWNADLVNKQLISKYGKGTAFVLSVIDAF